jgi:hypothetical protein
MSARRASFSPGTLRGSRSPRKELTQAKPALAHAIALAAACLGLAAAGGAAQAKSKKHQHHHHHHHHQKGGGSASEGRDHLKRANALAGDGDCDAAIEEYTKAYDLLQDPVVLFNRAECYRRTGAGEKAADDYRAFLEKVPNAPNRAAIEAKIVALEAPEPPAGETAKTPPAREAGKTPPPAREAAKTPPREAAKAPPPPAPPKEAEESAPPPELPPPAPKPEVNDQPAVTVRAPREQDSAPSGGTRPWVWVALSVLVVGAGVGGYFMLRPRPEAPPETALGNYRF